MAKKVIALSLTAEYDRRLDEIARELAGDVARPNRSAAIKALIDDYNRQRIVRKRRQHNAQSA